VLLEIGATQAAAVARLAREAFPAAQIDVHSDLAGLDRVVAIS
jgi:methylase of polypeptide subunit release factors